MVLVSIQPAMLPCRVGVGRVGEIRVAAASKHVVQSNDYGVPGHDWKKQSPDPTGSSAWVTTAQE